MKSSSLRVPLILGTLALFTAVLVLPAEAAVGRGRSSMGSRGNRGWSQPYRRPSTPPPTRDYSRPYGSEPYRSAPPSGGCFLRGLAGGIAGGFLGSMLFRTFGGGGGAYGPGGYGGGGGIGLLEILLLAGLAFFAVRWFLARRQAQPAMAGYGSYGGAEEFRSQPEPVPPSEETPEEVLAASEPGYDERRFSDARLQDFFRLQNAYLNRDLGPVRNFLAPEIAPQLDEDVAELKRLGHVNRMENIAVRRAELVDGWREPGRVYATVAFEASLVDYTVDERTQEIVAGNRTEPTAFRENWTFVKEIGFGKGDSWRLSAIERLTA